MRRERMLYLALIILVALFACSSPEKEFENIKEENTFEAYKDYLEKYPDTPFKSEIEDSIHSLDFKKAVQINTFDSYEDFMEKHKSSEFEEKVNNKIKSLMGTIKGAFVSKYTKKPVHVDFNAIVFNIFKIADEKLNEEEKAKAKVRSEKYKIDLKDIKFESPNKFLINNVLPGKYVFVFLSTSGEFRDLGRELEVVSGELVDLGKIEIDTK